MKGVKHYTEDGLYEGETHKMPGDKVHTGKKHSEDSKPVSHKPDGPFKMNSSPFDAKRGLWANIRAKRARGEAPAAKGSKAHNEAVAAAKEINKKS